jgi:hypothetical protein
VGATIALFKQKLPLLALLLAVNALHAQPGVETSIDSSTIFIGQPFKVQYKLNLQASNVVAKWPQVPDSLLHFEVLHRSKPDTVFSNGTIASISQTLTYTSFDSGVWRVPALQFVNGKDQLANGGLLSDSPLVEVNYNLADTSQLLKDIKPNEDAKTTTPWLIYFAIAAGVLLLLLLLLFVWRHFKKKKRQPATEKDAYTIAMQMLDKLSIKEDDGEQAIKIFHTEQVQIFKNYLGVYTAADIRSKTSSDLLQILQHYPIAKEVLHQSASALRCADAVKFARYSPATATSLQQLEYIKDTIAALHHLAYQNSAI